MSGLSARLPKVSLPSRDRIKEALRTPGPFKRATGATILYIVALLGVYTIHARYFDVNVVMYSAVEDGAIALVLVAGILGALKFWRKFSRFEVVALLLIWAMGGYIFAISVPTVLDRSLSFYILEKIAERGGGVKQSALDDIFIKEYIPEYKLMQVRLTEQLNSGTIVIDHGCVRLTPWGRELSSMSSWFRHNLLPKHRELLGVYTDELTHPFSHDTAKVNYTC